MKTPVRLVSLVLLCLGSACGGLRSTHAEPSEHPADEARLLQLEQDMFTAIRTRDRQGLERILDERFELRVPGRHPCPSASEV